MRKNSPYLHSHGEITAKKWLMAILLTLLFTPWVAFAVAPLKLVVDNSGSENDENKNTAVNPGAYIYLIPNSENHLKSTLDRALLGVYRLHFSRPERVDTALLRENIKLDLTVTDEQLDLAEILLTHEFSKSIDYKPLVPKLSLDTIHEIDAYLFASEPEEFLTRLQFISNGISFFPLDLRKVAGDQIESAAFRRILQEPAFELNDSILNNMSFLGAKTELFEIIDILAKHASVERKKIWLPKLFRHYMTLMKSDFSFFKKNKTASPIPLEVSIVLQKIAALLRPYVEADPKLAKNLKGEVFGKYGALSDYSLDGLDYWYDCFIRHGLISGEHELVTAQYASYVQGWASKAVPSLNPQSEFRFRRYISMLPEESRSATLLGLLSTALVAHSFDKFLIQKELTASTKQIYKIILDEGLKGLSKDDSANFVIKISMAYLRGQENLEEPNGEFEHYLIDLLKSYVSPSVALRQTLLENFEITMKAAAFGPLSFLITMRDIFKNEEELLERFNHQYVHFLKRKIKTRVMDGKLSHAGLRQGKASLDILKSLMDPADYFDFIDHAARVTATGPRDENKLLTEVKKQFANYRDGRPRSKKHLKLINCENSLRNK